MKVMILHAKDDVLIVKGKEIRLTKEKDPASLSWKELGVVSRRQNQDRGYKEKYLTLITAIRDYQARQRRFGKTGEQIS